MSKIFKRPMFRRGGEVGGGIMTGVMREDYEIGGSAKERLLKAFEEYPDKGVDPLSQFLIQGGLNLMSQTPTGGLLTTASEAFKEPTAGLFKNLGAEQRAKREIALAGEQLDIESDLALRLAREKAKADAAYQKDYTPDRKYYELVKDRTAASAALKSFEKRNIDLQFPRGTSRFDAYYANDLIQSENPIALDIKSNFDKFVPYDDKTGQLKYDEMIPGMYYFDPDREVYIQNVPPSESDEGGFYIVNPITYEKRKIQR
jgi:hypothetical protein